jgi:S1-C subfamily serine protease
MLIDILIVLFSITAVYRGRELGFVRQLCSTVGFFGGLFIGAWLEPHTVGLAHSQLSRILITFATTLGCALIFLTIGEYAGVHLKHKVVVRRINFLDNGLGAVLGVVSFLVSAWLTAAIITALPFPSLQASFHNSHIVGALDRVLPNAPTVIADLGNLIDPNGFPQVFIGNEPAPRGNVNLPSLGSLRAAVNRDKDSVVKVEGQGCGGIVEGSGFVVGSNLVATNAHVVAGIRHPYVQDANGTHSTTVLWFDPNLDFAVLRVANLAGPSLVISQSPVAHGTPAAVLGYPGGGPLTAGPAAVLDQFTASGRNIYGRGNTERDVYELQADVIPGNSGGPLVAKDGSVIGVIFAESTAYQHVGYALTTSQVTSAINQAAAHNQPTGTGRCAE